MKFFLLVVATCGIAAGLPATHIIGSAINGTGSIWGKGVDLATNLATSGISVGNSTFQNATSHINSTASAFVDRALVALNQGFSRANSTVQAGANMASSTIKSVGDNLKGIWGVGSIIQAGTNLTASAFDKAANMTGTGTAALQRFRTKKFGLIKSAVNKTTSLVNGIASSGSNCTKNAITAVGSTASSIVTSGANKTASAVNSVFSFFG